MRIIAFVASGVGNCIVKSPLVELLSEPKSNTATELSALVSLNINAPLAVIVELLHVVLLKSTKAVVPPVVGVTLTKTFPLAVYPVPLASLDVVYPVVEASKLAELV